MHELPNFISIKLKFFFVQYLLEVNASASRCVRGMQKQKVLFGRILDIDI